MAWYINFFVMSSQVKSASLYYLFRYLLLSFQTRERVRETNNLTVEYSRERRSVLEPRQTDKNPFTCMLTNNNKEEEGMKVKDARPKFPLSKAGGEKETGGRECKWGTYGNEDGIGP